MKKIVSLLCVLASIQLFSQTQTYLHQNVNLISHIDPNNDTLIPDGGNRYSGCWGWYQASKNKEYAISGTSNGTYFIDITVPASPSVCAFVPGKRKSTWREMKTYQNYCYIVTDDAQPNKFTIVDMKYLPDSVHIVHYGNTYFERGHTIWIDKNRMYVGATTYSSGSSCMTVWSLATPTAPLLLRRAEQDIPPPVFSYVHDMFVRNDTIYASTGWQGLHFLKFENSDTTLTHLGSYQGYPKATYNHSSSLTQNGKYVVFCDESPAAPIHLVDVQNFGNVQPLMDFLPTPNSLGHNPYVMGNKWAVVSCYQDGLQIYDISNPTQVSLAGFFDTYPQGGVNMGSYPGSPYSGNWGAYPYLPSGVIIANDMMNGVFILDPSAAFSSTVSNPVGISKNYGEPAFNMFPNPASEKLAVHFATTSTSILEIHNIIGNLVCSQSFDGRIAETLDVSALPNGSYFVTLRADGKQYSRKLIINH